MTDTGPRNSTGATEPKAGRRKKKRQWQANVDLPRGGEVERAKPLVIRRAGRTEYVDTLVGLPLGELEPCRHFVSRTTSRNKPNRPYLYNRGHHITVESEAEGIEAHLRDREANVEHIIPQGAWVKGLVRPLGEPNARPRWGWSCIDFLIGFRDGSIEAVEVKGHNYEFKKRPAAKLLATARTCADVGLDYRLMAGLSRREWLVFYQLHGKRGANYRPHPDHDRLRTAMADLAGAEAVTFSELRALGTPTVSAALIWELLWHGILCVDWTEPITSSTPIRRHGPACDRASGTSAWDFLCGLRREDMLPDLLEWAGQW